MTEIYAVVSRTLKLPDTVAKVHLNEPLVYGDEFAHAMRVKVYDEDGKPVPMNGCTVTGTFLRKADGTTVTPIIGTTDGNMADVVLPQSCYAVPGRFEFTMNITDGGNHRATMLVDGRVEKRTSEDIIDPGTPVTNYTQIIADAAAAASDAAAAAYTAENVIAFKEDLIGYFADSIIPYTHPLMELHSPYEEGGVTYGVRWNFDDNQEDMNTSVSAPNMYYAIYEIPKGTKLLKITAWHYSNKWAAYGFYDVMPGSTGAEVLGTYTSSTSGSIGPDIVAVPEGANYLVIHPAKVSAGRGVYPFIRTNFNVSAEQRPDAALVMRWNLFEHFFGDGEKWNYRVKHVVMTNNKIYAGVSYETMVPYRIIEKAHPSLFDNTAGSEVAFDIENWDLSHDQPNPVYFGSIEDTTGKPYQVFHMAYYSGYLYVTLRVGGDPDPTKPGEINSYLVAIDTATRRTTFQVHDTDRIATVRVIGDRLLVGKRKSGWTLYSLEDPASPTEIVSAPVPESFKECQHGCMFTVGNEEYVAMGCYENGLAVYSIDTSTTPYTAGTPVKWEGLSSLGYRLNVFCVESYTSGGTQYLYATISTTNKGRRGGYNKSGIVAFDVSVPSQIKFLSFTEIPKEQCGYPALRVKHDGNTYIFQSATDPSPNYVRILGTKLYTNNEDKGIAVFDISDPANPVFQGNIPLGTWPSYFELYAGSGTAEEPPGIIVAGGNYDFIRGELPAVVAVTTVLGG